MREFEQREREPTPEHSFSIGLTVRQPANGFESLLAEFVIFLCELHPIPERRSGVQLLESRQITGAPLLAFFPRLLRDSVRVHVPLIAKMPGIKRTRVTRAIGAPRGEPLFHLIHEVYFDDLQACNFALNTPEGREDGADLMLWGKDIVTLMFAEAWE